MTREENLESLRAYIKSFDNLPEHALSEGVSLYELKVTLEIILDVLDPKEETSNE